MTDESLCLCKDRLLTACPGEWEPGCDLGNNADAVQPVKPAAQSCGCRTGECESKPTGCRMAREIGTRAQ